MADDNKIDPSVQFQEYVSQWERSVDQFFNNMMGTEQFSQQMNQMQQLQLEFQRSFRDAMGGQLENMNMPSRDEVLAIQEDIRVLGDRMVRIEEKLDAVMGKNEPGKMPKRKSPPRTKQPPQKKEQ